MTTVGKSVGPNQTLVLRWCPKQDSTPDWLSGAFDRFCEFDRSDQIPVIGSDVDVSI